MIYKKIKKVFENVNVKDITLRLANITEGKTNKK